MTLQENGVSDVAMRSMFFDPEAAEDAPQQLYGELKERMLV